MRSLLSKRFFLLILYWRTPEWSVAAYWRLDAKSPYLYAQPIIDCLIASETVEVDVDVQAVWTLKFKDWTFINASDWDSFRGRATCDV